MLLVLVLVTFAWWVRIIEEVGLIGIILGVWLIMALVTDASWVVDRWNRWWVWVSMSFVFVIVAAVGFELISAPE